MKSLSTIILGLLTLPAAIASAADSEKMTSTTTDTSGTTVVSETSYRNTVGARGEKKERSEVSTIVDPKGMMNKESVHESAEKVVEPDGDFSESETIRHADGTLEVNSLEKKTRNHITNAGKTITKTETRSLDPKGLGNKETRTLEEKEVINPDGSSVKTQTEELNGQRVSNEKRLE